MRKHTKATAPGEDSIDIPFTAQEEIDRDYEEANPTPPPTKAERIAAITSGSEMQTLVFKMFFILNNEVRVLKGQQPITIEAFLTYLEGELV